MQERSSYPHQRVLSRFILEHSSDAVVVLDRDGVLVDANAAAAGARSLDVIGLFHSDAQERSALASLREELQANGRSTLEIERTRADGTTAHLLLEGVAVDGWFVVVVRDRSRRREIEEELRQLRGLASIGFLTAGIAHDFNNLLTPILALSSLLAGKLQGEQAEAAAEIETAADRAARLTRTVLNLARPRSAVIEAVDVSTTVAQLSPLIERLVGDEIALVLCLEKTVSDTLVERARFEHALLNLVANARDAMPHGGRLTVTTHNVVGDPNGQGPSTVQPYVLLAVTDTGAGMTEDVRARIFDPFFTTKQADGGSGLGLSSVRRFVVESGGSISVQSEVGQGTTVSVYLPRAHVPYSRQRSVPDPELRGGQECVLVIGADEQVRRAVRRVLEARGYSVLDAESEKTAIYVASTSDRRVDLVLADSTLPRQTQQAVREGLRGLAARAPLVIMSGRTDVERGGFAAAGADLRLLRKPFSSDELLREVRAALDARP